MAKPTNSSVKIEAKLARKAKMIAAQRDITMAEYLSELLAGPISRDFEKMKRELSAEKPEGDSGA